MLKAVIFDMDGVLINSTEYTWQSFNTVLKQFGAKFSSSDIKKYLGVSLQDKWQIWKKKYGITGYDVDSFSRKATEIEFKLMKKELRPSGVLNNFLQSLKEKGLKLAVATSSNRERVEKILEMLEIKGFFEALVTAEDVKKSKPNPEIFLKAAAKLKTSPENCVVFEDAVNGIEAARKAGMKVVALQTEFHSKEELKYAEKIIRNFSEIDAETLEKMV